MNETQRRRRKASIMKWMVEHGLSQTAVASAVKRDISLVCYWVSGDRTSPAVAEFFRRHGMPERLINKGFRKAA